mmetsp:Transcript_29801/g.96135  ORF Transcript_29801/g.96135 Transcript_29801/m.96135 type:complete len:202 (-) Transcript_29801:149-754(-)
MDPRPGPPMLAAQSRTRRRSLLRRRPHDHAGSQGPRGIFSPGRRGPGRHPRTRRPRPPGAVFRADGPLVTTKVGSRRVARLQERALRPRPELHHDKHTRRGHRPRQRQPLRQRHGHLLQVRRRHEKVPIRSRRRTSRRQPRHTRPPPLLLLHRLARLHPRRPPLLRQAGHPVLHTNQNHHFQLARQRRRRSPGRQQRQREE